MYKENTNLCFCFLRLFKIFFYTRQNKVFPRISFFDNNRSSIELKSYQMTTVNVIKHLNLLNQLKKQ